jgi:uncharacterized protein (TIGR02597 family)
MKLKFSQSILAATVLLGLPSLVLGQTATTKPVGFQSVTLKSGVFNLVGVNFLKAPIVVGLLDSLNAGSITDADVDFSTALAGQSNLVIEITSGPGVGLWANVSAPTSTQITVDTDLTATVTGGAAYQIFSLPTISDIFGATNSAGLKGGLPTAADVIWLSTGNGSGSYDKYYYSLGAPFGLGWRKVGGGTANQAGEPVYHHEAMIIERRDVSDLTVTFAGTVKTSPTAVPVFTGFNFIERSFPTLATLSNSGISAYLGGGLPSGAATDIVWIPNGSGAYDKYYVSTGAPFGVGWRKVGGGTTDASSTALSSGIIIERKGANTNIKIMPDAAYSSL